MSKFYQVFLLGAIAVFFSMTVDAQIQINVSNSAQALAQRLVGDGVVISNIVFTGADGSAGFFKNVSTNPNLGIDSGIVLSTGQVKNAYPTVGIIGIDGPASSFANNNNFQPGDADLDAIIGAASTQDACLLEFDFTPLGDTISFNYVFASEEYPLFTCTEFNDIFAFLISGGSQYPVKTNIALVPGTTIPVAINSINGGIPGPSGTIADCNSMGPGSPFTLLYTDNSASSTMSFGGFTHVLKAMALVTPCTTYHLKLVVADKDDGNYDTNVFLEAKSLSSNAIKIDNLTQSDPLGNSYLVEGCATGSFVVKRPIVNAFPLSVNLSYGGTAQNGIDVQLLPTTVTIPANDSMVTVNVIPIIDNIPEGIETLIIYALAGCATGQPTDSAMIQIRDYDTLGVIPDSAGICKGATIQIAATAGYTTYQWDANPTLNNTGIRNPVATPVSSETTYYCTATEGTCNARDSAFIKWKQIRFISKQDVICHNGTTGQIMVAGGWEWTRPIEFSISGNPYQPDSTFNNLPVGTYTIKVKDALNCIDSITINIVQSFPDLLINGNSTPANCSANNGSIVLNGSGGLSPYLYSIDGITYTVTNTFPATSGNHTVYVQDANNCITSTVVNVGTINGPQLAVVKTDATCGNSNGTITATVTSGGVAPFQYSINGTVFQPTGIFTTVAAGPYTVTVRDALNCIVTFNIVVGNIEPTLTATETDEVCGRGNGTITAVGSNGAAPLQYSINGTLFQASGVFTGLSAGPYTVTVRDANNCTATFNITVNNIAGPTLAVVRTDATCGFNNGSIAASVSSGGTPPFQYSLDGVVFQSTGIFPGLAAGPYTVTVIDANNCIGTLNLIINIIAIPQVSAVKTDETCGNSNGTITVTGTNGTPPLQYSIDGVVFQTATVFTGIAAGSYTITVRDVHNCTSTTNIVVNNIPGPQMTDSVTNASCDNNDGMIRIFLTGGTAPFLYQLNGGSFQTSNIFSPLAVGTYNINVKDANNCTASQNVTVNLNNTLLVNAGIDDTICESKSVVLQATSNGTSFSWSPATGLDNTAILNPLASPVITTTYYLTASRGICSDIDTVIVLVHPAPVPDAGADVTTCFETNIQLHATGGDKYYWRPATFLSNTDIPDPICLQPTASIKYMLTAWDIYGCKSLYIDTMKVIVNPQVIVFAGNDTLIGINQPLQLNGIQIGSPPVIQFNWSPSYGLNDPNIASPVAILDRDMTYTLTGHTAFGCEGSDEIKIKVYNGPQIYVPNTFTPNGDGTNDVLRAIAIGMKEFHYFRIYNRWGEPVFSTVDFAKGWDGKVQGRDQSTGTYVWMAEAVDYKGNTVQRKGTTMILR